MAIKDNRVDTYIVKSADFAVPILSHLRSVVHDACPEVRETIKWSFPHFEFRNTILCSMASFKQHCAFTIWLASQMQDPHGILTTGAGRPAMGHLGRITCLEDLPPDDILIGYLKDAMVLIEQGVKLTKKEPETASKELEIPDYFQKELENHPDALDTFNRFSYSGKKEYVEWIRDAKTEETRRKRLATAIDWLIEGKSRNWKYLK